MGGSKTPLSLILAWLLAALLAGQPPTLPAAAQGAAGEAGPPAEGTAATRVQSYTTDLSPGALQSVKLESLLGREVRTRDEDPGRIIDIMADRDGQVRAAVVELGGFLGIGTRKIVVEWSALRFDSAGKRQIVVVDRTREQLRSAPEYKPTAPAFMGRAD